MIRISTSLALAGLLFSSLCIAQTGVVRSEGQALPGASVKATQGDRVLLTLTDDKGAFQFDGMTLGMWVVEVDIFGFDHARKEVQIGSNPSKIDFTMQLADRGRPAGGRPQENNPEGAAPETQDIVGEAVTPAGAPPVAAEGSNESLLVNGSLSEGLQSQPGDIRPDFGGPGGPGGLGLQVGPNAQAGPGVPGAPGGGGPGGGGPGGGGFGGGRGGGGFGGGGFGGGGFGGRGGGRGGPRGRNGNPAFIGNRRPNNNRITGSIFYRMGNSVLDARPFSVNGLVEPKAAYAQNYFGFSAGGPLFIPKLFNFDKVFWFINYNGTLLRNGVDQAYTVPTVDERMGNFAGVPGVQLYAPASQTCPGFSGVNIIPSSCLSSTAQNLLLNYNYIPLPNQGAALTQNYRLVASNPSNTQNLNTRVNTNVTQRDTLALTFNLQRRNTQTFEPYGCCDSSNGQGINVNLNWRRRFGARSFNNATLTFNRNTNLTVPVFANGPNVASALQILGPPNNPVDYGPPNLSFTSYSGLNDSNWSKSATWSYGAGDTLQYRVGKHNWSFGGGFTHFLNNTITDPNARGTFAFSNLATAGYDANGLPLPKTGNDFASFLLGLPETSSIRYGDTSTYFRSNGYNTFATDDWRVANNLTLILGVRYEYFTPWHEEYGHIANLDIAPGFASVAQVTPGQAGPLTGVLYPSALINPDHHDIGPRLGLAWKPSAKSKIVFRTGYGIYYTPNQYNKFESNLAAQPPFAVSNYITTSSADLLTLADGLVAVPAGKSVTNTYGVALDYHDTYIQSWNFSIQSDLPGRLVGEIMYIGSKTTNLDVQQAPNQAQLGSALNSEQRLPIASAGSFIFDDPVGDATYEAVQFRLTRRFQRGLSMNLLYTFSKALDDAVLAQNFLDQSAEKALSSSNRAQVLTLNWVWASPVDATRGFLSHPAWAAKALKDWTVSGNLTAETGLPLTPTVLGNLDGTASIAPLRADATGIPVDSGPGYFNPAAFAVPPAGQYGNAGRDTIIGPGMFALNMSLARSINLNSERRRLEIRVDATNPLNHVNPSGLVTTVNSLQFAEITSAGQMRQLTATIRFRF